MNANTSAYLNLTAKGREEVEHRAYKLDIKRRSVLLLLDKPHTIAEVLRTTVFPEEEILEGIQLLVRDGFIELAREGAQPPAATPPPSPPPHAPASAGGLRLDDEIMLSEAKFLLVDFCVDSFGTDSQAFVDQIRASKTVRELESYLKQVFDATKKLCPDRLPILAGVVKEINETA